MKDAGELQKKFHMKRSSIQKLPRALLRNRGEVYELLQIRNVSHCFSQKENAKLILEDMSLQVEEGEFISILGPSGCGKTTLLSIIAGCLIQLKVSSF